MKKISIIVVSLLMLVSLSACKKSNSIQSKYKDAKTIVLTNDKASIDGEEIEEYDYTWHVDVGVVHDDVKDAPAEYYTGNKPDENVNIYIDHELYYYPKLDSTKFIKVDYDGEKEWAYYYEDGVNNDYIFSTLPCFATDEKPLDSMMFTEQEASNNKVLHIKEAGTYILQGKWNGQINIDLGEESFADESCKVTIILNDVDVNCTVAPAIIFENAYECDNKWEDRDEKVDEIDTTNAGVNVIVCDNTTNNISGKNIYRMLKTKYKDNDSKDEIKVQKKQRKVDAPLYSCVSMNINGEENNDGILNITSSFEGLDSELHLTINGSLINIDSQDDGINVNEDNVSIVSFKGGIITINAANGNEGDGVDSNGYVVIDGSILKINNIRVPDNAIDSNNGISYKSGTIYIDDKLQNIQVGSYHEIGGTSTDDGPVPGFDDFDIKEVKEKILKLPDDATLQDVLDILGMDRRPFDEIPRDEKPFNQERPDDNFKK